VEAQRSYYILTGPTAGGKTAWLLERSQRIPLAVISADSRQVYRFMDIGTGKSTPAEQQRLPQFGLDLHDPFNIFSVYQYYDYSVGVLTQLEGFAGEVWFCGGTGLYLRAVLENLPLGAAPRPSLRPAIEAALAEHGARTLAARLGLALADPDNPQRVLRAVEGWYAGGEYSPQAAAALGLPPDEAAAPGAAGRPVPPRHGWACAGLAVLDPGKEELGRRIEARVRGMFGGGLLEEVRALERRGFAAAPVVAGGIGYREALAVVHGGLTLDEAIASTIVRTRQYAKRQRTYFRGRGWPVYTERELPF
jgi:tRNA dimethylallyltransferase